MKNEPKEIVLEKGEKYKRVARKPEQSEPEFITINNFEKNLNGEWIEDTDEPLYIEFSDIIKIYKAWGKKKEVNPEELARKFHETYEKLAPKFGYKTRKESSVSWDKVPEKNKNLMIAVCKEINKILIEKTS